MKNTGLILKFIAVLLFITFSGCEKENIPFLQKDKSPSSLEQSKSDNSKDIDRKSGISNVNQSDVSGRELKITGNDITVRMIVKTGTMSVETDNYDEAEKRISEIVKKYNGYVFGSSSSVNSGGKKQGSIILKIPSDKFDYIIPEISQTGKVMSRNISSSDVTEEYIDLEARMKTQKELEQRLLKLITEKAAKLSDIIEIENKISEVRRNIESTEGRMKFLRSQSDLSTLTVSVYEHSLLETSSGGGFFYELGQGLKKGLKGFTQVASGSIAILVALLPVFIIVYIVFVIIRKIIIKHRTKTVK